MKPNHHHMRKAAILVASLEPERADSLLRQISPSQAEALRQAVDELGAIDPAEQDEVLEEFFRIGPLVPDKQPSGIELDGPLNEQLLRLAPTDDGCRQPKQPCDAPFRFLHEAPAQSLAPFLEREHPQTIAVVISHLPSERAAEILAGLNADLQIDVARRLVDLEETDPEILREVELGLESRFSTQSQGERRRTAGLTALNNILGAAPPRTKQRILANLARHDRKLAGTIVSPPHPALTFAELEQLDAASLTVVLHHAPHELLVLALAGGTREFTERVFELFPPLEAGTLRHALRDLGPTRLSDVEEAQHELAALAHQLEIRGEIAPDIRGQLSVAV